ncbi:MAG: hypothetical protein ACT4P2_13185, partial [Pseudomonadota bacterium]
GRRYFVDGGGAAGAGKPRRLRVVESAAVDGRGRRGVGGRDAHAHRRVRVVAPAAAHGRSRLVLVRRDDIEHLLVLGPTAALVVETGIPAGFAAALEPGARAATASRTEGAGR